MPDQNNERAIRAGLVSALMLLGLAGCRSQLLPGPMSPTADPLPDGDTNLYLAGPEEVVVVRHADPAQVRPAGLSSSFPLQYYNKSMRLSSGSAVYTAPGGRLEVIWPGGTSVVLFGRCSGIIGSVSRGEPTFVFRELERVTLNIREGDQIELLGGSVLTAETGPFVVEHLPNDVLRVKNQTKRTAELAFRVEVFTLDPGQVIDVPLLSAGGSPLAQPGGFEDVGEGGRLAQYRGELDVNESTGALSFRANGDNEIMTLGQHIRLVEGDTCVVSGLDDSPAPPVPSQESLQP